jgi:xylitol oxidase
MSTPLMNWAGNLAYSTNNLHCPQSIEQLREIVLRSPKLKVLGSRHSFNRIADSACALVSLEVLPQIIDIDTQRMTATISAGLRYGDIAPALHRAGVALHNMASLPHISVAGAVATGTHGSGDTNGNLASAVRAIEFMKADGEMVTLSRERDGDRFKGAVVHLGALGIVTRLMLDVQPAFFVQQDVYEKLPLAELETHFDAIMGSAYSVSLFHDWQHDTVNQVWLKRRLAEGDALPISPIFFGAKLVPAQRHPIAEMPADPATVQMGIPGAWHERLPHFRLDQTPSAGEELQSEYFVHRRHAIDAMRAIATLKDLLRPHLMISEVRSIAADDLWLSGSYKQDAIGFHFTWQRNWPAVRELLPRIEASLAPFAPRPHWGKCFTLPAVELQKRYERMNDFRALANEFDPHGKFRNAFLDAFVFG